MGMSIWQYGLEESIERQLWGGMPQRQVSGIGRTRQKRSPSSPAAFSEVPDLRLDDGLCFTRPKAVLADFGKQPFACIY